MAVQVERQLDATRPIAPETAEVRALLRDYERASLHDEHLALHSGNVLLIA